MSSLNDKLSKLKKKTDLTNLSALDLLSMGKKDAQVPVEQKTDMLPDILSPADDIIIPSSVGDVFVKQEIEKQKQQELKEIDSDLNIKKTGFSLNSLKSNIYAILNKTGEQETNDKLEANLPEELEDTDTESVEEIKPKKSRKKKSLEDLGTELKQEIGNNEISETIEEIEEEIKTKYKKKTKKELPEDIKITEVIEDIQEILEDIPNTDDISLTDFEIINTKSKKGYTKTVVGFKGNTPKEISDIATYARKVSDNLIKPRTMNILNIQNINKTQLRDSALKLPLRSYTFKPDHTKMKVSKFNRFIISIHDDFESTKEVYIYLQESRTKYVTKVPCDVEYIGKLIYSFYNEGIEVTKRKLQFKNTQNPLLRLVPELIKGKHFKVKPIKVDEESETVKGLKLKLITGVNPWLSVIIKQVGEGLVNIYLEADFDESWRIRINEGFLKKKTPLEIAYLHTEDFFNKLIIVTNKDISKFKAVGLDVDDVDTKNAMLLNNLKHRNLRKVFIEMIEYIEDTNNENGLEIIKTYSQIETKKLAELEKQEDYNAEIIIGKSNNIDYFIISYFALLIKGGDVRKGRQYITRPQYYQRYNVKDKRDYEERVRTVIVKEGKERNYDARPYMFKIEAKINGKETEMIAKTFEEINSKYKIF